MSFEEEKSGSFDLFDVSTAEMVFSLWQTEQSQELEDWLMRQRKAELDALVRKVIKNEFSKEDKYLIKLRWYENFSIEEIMGKTGMSRSALYRRYDKINDVLFEKLKYALEYRFGYRNEKAYQLVKSNVKNCCSHKNMFHVANRLTKLREKNYLSVNDVSEYTGIPCERLVILEKWGRDIRTEELKKLAEFYHVSTDYILFGKTRILRDQITGLPVYCDC